MSKKSSKKNTVVLDLDETIPSDVQAKLYYLCKKRRLPYPEGIVCLMEEAVKGINSRSCTKKAR